jgi:WD40 repeat protein
MELPMKKINLTLALILITLLSGCSQKKYFEPDEVHGEVEASASLPHTIIDTTQSGATLEEGFIVTTNNLQTAKVLEGYTLISADNNWLISTKPEGDLMITPLQSNHKVYEFKMHTRAASASIHENLLAVVFANNTIALYNLESKELLFKQTNETSVALDAKISSPSFLDDLVIFPTLNGQLVIVQVPSYQVVKTIAISSNDYFNNVIYATIEGNVIVAATPHQLFTLNNIEFRKKMQIRDLRLTPEGILVALKDGTIALYDPSLSLIKKINLPFAHYLGVIDTTTHFYLLEKQGFLVELTKDLSSYKLYEVDIPKEGYAFTSKDSFFINEAILKVTK